MDYWGRLRISLFSSLLWWARAHHCSVQRTCCVCLCFSSYTLVHVCCMFDNTPSSSAGVSLLPVSASLIHPPWPLLSLNHLLTSHSQVLIGHTLIWLFHYPLSWNLTCWELILLWHPTSNIFNSLYLKSIYNWNKQVCWKSKPNCLLINSWNWNILVSSHLLTTV